MPECTLEQHVIYYQTSDQSQSSGTLLFIHGSGASQESWREQMPALPPGFMGIAVDLPGHGLSPGPALNQVTDLAEVVLDIIRRLNPPRPLIMTGHSLGAAIALQSSCLDGQIIDGLILMGGGARMRVLPSFLAQLATGSVDLGFFRLAFAPETDPALVENELKRYADITPDLLFHDFTACNDFDLTNNLQSIIMPVLLIVGEHDRLTPPKSSAFLQEKLARAELVTVPAAGHFAMLEQPVQVNLAIKTFCHTFCSSLKPSPMEFYPALPDINT